MEKAKPVSDLVNRRLALVVAVHGIGHSRHATCQDIAAISGIVDCRILCWWIAICDGGRQGTIPKQCGWLTTPRIRGEVGLEVEIKILVGPAAEMLLHLRGVGIGSPIVSDGVCAACLIIVEGDIRRAVGYVHGGHLHCRLVSMFAIDDTRYDTIGSANFVVEKLYYGQHDGASVSLPDPG